MRNTHEVTTRLRAAMLTMLCVAAAASTLVSVPALAAEQNPTLTVHVTEGTAGSASENGDGAELPQNQQPQSAGAGFIYELIRLDADKVASAPGNQAEATKTVLSNIDDYTLLVDGAKVSVLGVSDNKGDITTTGAASDNPAAGTWVTGGSIKNGTVDGGTAYQFEGTTLNPQYWYLRLVYHPAGLEIQRSEPGLVALPYVESAGDSTGSKIIYDVNVYPKTQACTDTSLPDGPVQIAAAFEVKGQHSNARSQARTTSFRRQGDAVMTTLLTPAAYSSCRNASRPVVPPTPEPAQPGIPERIVNEIKNGVKYGLAKTGVGLEWIVLAVLALVILGLITLSVRRRGAGRDDNHNGQRESGQQPAVRVEEDQR